ncbi:uncharacterized protein UTRI_05430_B [Ustilago trichophora]|uniref:Uncharacterized protein n=1 Tax=Ustilago trichophora TaxID=86804 RepID=A0A5C3EMM1_9BASI|nr:uncharacterized protein UTRI_05430_B [Ustilago trichophora]
MSSVAFPAFQRAQQEHMGFDRSAEELYQSVENAVRAPSRNSLVQVQASDAVSVGNAASISQSALGNNLSESSEPSKPKITKRVNARLQLAAALIEADNERILEKAQFWHIYHPPQPDEALHPPPPPEPALASQSAIFAPYREGASVAVKRHVRTWSAATGLSRLLDPDDDGRRPSIDFLGVALPTEQKARSRAGSSVAGLIGTEAPRSRSNSLFSNAATSVLGRTSKLGSRPASLLDPAADEDVASDADALSEWGVDKFLSKEERERIALGQRERAQSVAGSAGGRPSFEQLAPSVTGRKSMEAAPVAPESTPIPGRASSEIVGASTGSVAGDPKLELLAKIKLYRERQENLPPSEWDGPGPTASKDEVVDHIIASSDNNKRVSLRQASRELSEASDPLAMSSIEQDGGTKTNPATGSIMDRPRPSSRADSTTSSAFLNGPVTKDDQINSLAQDPPAPPASDLHFFGAAGAQPPSPGQDRLGAATAETLPRSTQSKAIPIPQAGIVASQDPLQQEISAEHVDMVGVGSFSRSQSRRNSFLGGPLFNPHSQSTGPSPSMGMEQSASVPSFAPQAGWPAAPAPGPGPSPLGHARIPSRGWTTDQFAEHDLGLGPSPFAAALHAASPSFHTLPEFRNTEAGPSSGATPAIDFNSLSTRQLQNVARNSTFPMHLGINRDLLAEQELDDADVHLHENEFGQMPKPKRPLSYDITALAQDLAKTGGENFEIQLGGGAAPDLSSANWGKPRKKWFRLSMMMDAKGKPLKPKKATATDGDDGDGESDAEVLETAGVVVDQPGRTEDLSDLYAAEPAANMNIDAAVPTERDESDDVDDDYISPPRRGPLRPRGLAARTPKTILMPQPLQGTEFAPKLRLTDAMPAMLDNPPAPKRHSLHVPDGFVLHDSRGGLPPMRSLVVHSANGPQPMFAAKAGNKKQEQVSARLKAVDVGRTVQVPAAAPRGIGRRAAAPTTALFRNHLVQHDDEREGWGWEAGTRVDDIFNPNQEDDSDDDDKPLADIKKQSRSAKRAAKRLAKEKRKRKAARRIRRAKREEALQQGKSFKEVGVDELSPDEDLDLSSTTSEEDVTDSETESDLWASDDDKRWVDDSKPAGKLYGKSLLDIATERNTERKSKARFYGQVQLEDGETTMLQVDGDNDDATSQRLGVRGIVAGSVIDDGASVAPSVARSFRDKPIGYNDTRERMEAVFGADQIWAREMAKRQEEEAQEAQAARERAEAQAAAEQQREADVKAKKERGIFTLPKKSKKKRETALGMLNPSAINSTASFTGSNAGGSSITPSQRAAQGQEEAEQSESPLRSQTPIEPPVIALDIGDANDEADQGRSGRRTPALLAGEETAAQEWLISSDAESEKVGQDNDSSDDDIPLSQVKKNVASRPVSLAAGLSLNPTKSGDADSSDEELPLAALKEKRIRQSMMLGGGKLDLDFSSSNRNGSSAAQSASPSSIRSGSMRDNGQDAVKSPLSQAYAARPAQAVDDDDSDEDLPLGQRHPGGDAALIAMRTALEKEKRALKEARQAEKAQKRAAKLARQVSTEEVGADGERVKANGDLEDGDDDSEEDDSEDDKPLGYVHPQAAIIAEQAALIRQLQQEKEQQQQHQPPQHHMGGLSPSGSGILSPSGMDMRSSMMFNRMSGLPNLGGMGGMGGTGMPDPRHSMMGLPTNGSMMMGMPQLDGLPAASSGLPFSMSMSSPMPLGMPMGMGGASPMAPGSQIGVSGAMSPAMTMPMIAGTPQIGTPMTPNPMTMMLDPKASSIHNWRTQVPADATATVTPPGGTSAVNSAI